MESAMMRVFLLGLLATASAQVGTVCNPRKFEFDSVVCVCNATFCDLPGPTTWPDPGFYTVVTSSREGLRFATENFSLQPTAQAGTSKVELNGTVYQTMLGFGGAFTDATGINIKRLSAVTQENVLKAYFSTDGIQYDLCRIPIAGSDFSTRPYSYDDVVGDVALANFALTEEDFLYKLPMIQRAMELSDREILLFGSPWSPPAWMKTNGMFNESGELLKEMWQPYSNYFVKFVEAYEAAGAPIWGLTTQNEPLSGFDPNWHWNTCGWTAEDMRDWIKTNLGPTLQAAGMRRLKLMVDDFNRDTLPWYPQVMLEDAAAYSFIDGVAVHWYSDKYVGPEVLSEIHLLFPEKFLLYTEACEGFDQSGLERGVHLGSWVRAESYATNILEDINYYSSGWVDWNMALDMEGGPNWANNLVDSPVIVNADADEFYKQPIFYIMGHFSKWVLPGSQRLASMVVGTAQDNVQLASFSSPTGHKLLVLINTGDVDQSLSVRKDDTSFLNFVIPSRAVQTVLF